MAGEAFAFLLSSFLTLKVASSSGTTTVAMSPPSTPSTSSPSLSRKSKKLVRQAFIGVKTRRMKSYYEDLLAQETDIGGSREQDISCCSFRKWRKQIEKDIPRTFPGHPALDEIGRNSLRHLLPAYAQHKTPIEYCQVWGSRTISLANQ